MAARMTKSDEAYSIGLSIGLSKGFDNGVTLERERILKILRARLGATDEVCEAQAWRALDEVIARIAGRPLIEVLANETD